MAINTALMIVPTLRVGMQPVTLRVTQGTQSVQGGVTTQGVGAINKAFNRNCF